jgi:hypothetical protein
MTNAARGQSPAYRRAGLTHTARGVPHHKSRADENGRRALRGLRPSPKGRRYCSCRLECTAEMADWSSSMPARACTARA